MEARLWHWVEALLNNRQAPPDNPHGSYHLLNAQLAFGHVALLDHTGFSLETNERVGLIGRNGAGKSSLLKILGGLAKPDDGTLQVQQGTRIAFVEQEPALTPTPPSSRRPLPGWLG